VGLAIAALCLPAAIFYVYPIVQSAPKAPLEVAAADIGKASRPEDLPAKWITFTFDNAVDSGFTRGQAGSNHVDEVYILVPVGDRWLSAAVPPNFQDNRLTGMMRTIPAFEFDDIHAATMETHQGQLMPFQFDTISPHDGNIQTLFFMLLGGAAFGGLIGMVGLHYTVQGLYYEPKPVSEPAEEPLFGTMPSFAGKDQPTGLYR
jgi:hypothetical protein